MSSTRRQAIAARVDAERVAPVDVVVDQRRQQVVGGGDGVEIAGEVQVDLLHRHDLGVAAAGRAALHAEAGAERGLAQADHRLLADPVQPVAQADRRRRLALAGRRRVDRRDQDQLAVGPARAGPSMKLAADLGDVPAIGLERVRGMPSPRRDLAGSASASPRGRSRDRSPCDTPLSRPLVQVVRAVVPAQHPSGRRESRMTDASISGLKASNQPP